MDKLPETREADAEDVNVGSIFALAWSGRSLICWTTLVFALVACGAAFVLPKSFVATSIIAPVSNSSSGSLGGLSSLVSQFGGLASLAGISMGGDSKKFESLAVLQSEQLTEKYIVSNDLLPILFASRWDPARNTWKSTDPKKIPTPWQANQYFKTIRTVSTDTKTGLITIAITWKDPKTAARWVNDLVNLTNEHLRNKAIREGEADVAYLNEQASKTDAVAVKQGIYNMLQNEINKIMVAKGSNEFALKVLDPAIAPEKPSSPLPVRWTLEGFFAGLLLSLLIVFNRKRRPNLSAAY
jgi:uncharacterized protein involved in exopolysaccharide biosynthesis